MTSRVLVKLPVVPFSQRKSKSPPEVIPLSSRNGEYDDTILQNLGIDRVTHLEQNMKFLQDQHQITLSALHLEVESLRQRNRDLQFQLVFTKGSNSSSCNTSPEDSENNFPKTKGSPSAVNVTPLQIELLEKDLQDLKATLIESKERNKCLAEVVEKQKKRLEIVEKSKEKLKISDASVQVCSSLELQQSEVQKRLEDSEALIKRLRRENEDQRKEIASLKSFNSYGNGNNGGRNNSRGSNSYHNRSSSHEIVQDENFHKFPPLQSYWHRNVRGNQSFEHNPPTEYNQRNGRHHQQQQQQPQQPPPEKAVYCSDIETNVLPQVQNGSVRVDSSSNFPPFFRNRGGNYSGGSYYSKDGGGGGASRKYRGQNKSQRDQHQNSRDYQDTREYHAEYHNQQQQQPHHNHNNHHHHHHHHTNYREEQNDRGQQTRDCPSSSRNSRDCKNAQRQ